MAEQLEEIEVRLGSGNDVIDVATDTNLTKTTVRVDGGSGDDSLTPTSLSSRTVWNGGADEDTVSVVISGVPTSTQLSNLRLDTEQLVVDNRGNSTAIAWVLSDLTLTSDLRVGGLPQGNPLTVLSTDGVVRTKILGGTGDDSLDVITSTITETFGEIDLDSQETDSLDNVQLDFGGEVFVPDTEQRLRRSEVNLDFDRFGLSGRSYHFNDASLSSTGVLRTDRALGQSAVGSSSATDLLTFSMDSGNPFSLNSIDLATKTGSGSRTIQLTGTLTDGTVETIDVTISESNGFESLTSFGFTDNVRQLTLSLQGDELLGGVTFEERSLLEFRGALSDATTYREDGFEVTADAPLRPSFLTFSGTEYGEVLSIDESFERQTDIRIEANSGTFRIQSFRVKDTLRNANIGFIINNPFTGFYNFQGNAGYQTVNINSGFSTGFSIGLGVNQVIDEIVVVPLGAEPVTIGFENLVDGSTTYEEDGFTITNGNETVGLEAMRLVDGGVTDQRSNTVRIQRQDSSPFSADRLGLLIEGFGAINEYVDVTAEFPAADPITQRLSAAAFSGQQNLTLNGFDDVSAITFQLQGGRDVFQLIDDVVIKSDGSRSFDFDGYVPQAAPYAEDGLELISTGTLGGFDEGGLAIGVGSSTDQLTLRPQSAIEVTQDRVVAPVNYELVQAGGGIAPA
ncbi:MAG: hypothetical protein AAGJ83_11820, partial [Planctomycetota bacterium]